MASRCQPLSELANKRRAVSSHGSISVFSRHANLETEKWMTDIPGSVTVVEAQRLERHEGAEIFLINVRLPWILKNLML